MVFFHVIVVFALAMLIVVCLLIVGVFSLCLTSDVRPCSAVNKMLFYLHIEVNSNLTTSN